jgi:hypothetical protein
MNSKDHTSGHPESPFNRSARAATTIEAELFGTLPTLRVYHSVLPAYYGVNWRLCQRAKQYEDEGERHRRYPTSVEPREGDIDGDDTIAELTCLPRDRQEDPDSLEDRTEAWQATG